MMRRAGNAAAQKTESILRRWLESPAGGNLGAQLRYQYITRNGSTICEMKRNCLSRSDHYRTQKRLSIDSSTRTAAALTRKAYREEDNYRMATIDLVAMLKDDPEGP